MSTSGLGFSILGIEVLLFAVKHCFLGSCKQNYFIKPAEEYCRITYCSTKIHSKQRKTS